MNGGRLRVFQNSNPIGGPGMAYLPMAFLDISQEFHEFLMGNQLVITDEPKFRQRLLMPHDRAKN